MKQFTKALDKEGQCFMYLRKQFEKLKISKMFKDKNFILHMNEIEKSAWLSFKFIAENF